MRRSRTENRASFESALFRSQNEFSYAVDKIRHIPYDADLREHIEWMDLSKNNMEHNIEDDSIVQSAIHVPCRVTRNDCLVDAKACIDSMNQINVCKEYKEYKECMGPEDPNLRPRTPVRGPEDPNLRPGTPIRGPEETSEKEKIEEKKEARVLVICSGSLKRRGGGVVDGSDAQEESLCRRSNLFEALGHATTIIIPNVPAKEREKEKRRIHRPNRKPRPNPATFYSNISSSTSTTNGMDKEKERYSYPLHGKTKGIFLPDITVFRDEQENDIEPFTVDILVVFSRHCDAIKKDGLSLEQINRDIVEVIIMTMQKRKSTHVVLVPAGAGVFKNDPDNLAELLVEYLHATKRPECLREIVVSCYGIYRPEEEEGIRNIDEKKHDEKRKKDSYKSFSYYLNC